ncbi:MAG: amino acid permease [Gemmatimonadales bacterium]|nr:amino acid permease [Gemmatimonadales bacterium]NIN10157.1 amino acid permease [Gemmatimonadales bacterium]NIN48824.1 amino acid permease [Gemmatimonadales bacterium]NIP06288.1 amino acid permease [Gemmatimonadales bacterium]NIQ99265.1 amino acid permease [Gemmatimonadales bacterium]
MTVPGALKLRRVIGLSHATALVVGTIIGASIFVQPSEITGQVPSILGMLLVWLISGGLTLIGALVCAELAATFTRTGGVYVYLKETYGPALGFLWGWAMFWTMHTGIIAAIAVIFARYAAYFIPLGDWGIKALAAAAILLLSAVNYMGVKHGSRLQALFTLGKLLAIALIIVLGFVLGARLPEHFVTPETVDAGVTLSDFLTALVAGLFAFGGWHMVTYSAEETINPRVTIPRALLFGTLIVTLCYVAMNVVYVYVLPLDVVASSTRVAADAADTLIGYGGGAVMSAIVMFSTFGALSGIVLAGPRVYYSMAEDGLLFRWVGGIHPKFCTPHRAIVIQAVWASMLVASGTYRALFTRVIYTEWIFFGLMAIGLFMLRRRGRVSGKDWAWGYPVLPGLFVVASFAIVANQLVANTAESVVGLSFVLVGLPVYYFWARKGYGRYRHT